MKKLILATLVLLAAQAQANIECAGRATDKSFVRVEVVTTGANGIPSEGNVSFEQDGNTYGYNFTHDDVSQFFEYDDQAQSSAVVGLAAFVKNESPVSIKYVGPNFVDMDLKTVVDEGKADSIPDNTMYVWMGPGRASTDQVQLTKFACSVWY